MIVTDCSETKAAGDGAYERPITVEIRPTKIIILFKYALSITAF
jgi:hypothetical protein